MGKQQVGSLCLSPEIRGETSRRSKHQIMSLLPHIMIFARSILFCLCFWKPSTDGLGPSKDSTDQ